MYKKNPTNWSGFLSHFVFLSYIIKDNKQTELPAFVEFTTFSAPAAESLPRYTEGIFPTIRFMQTHHHADAHTDV